MWPRCNFSIVHAPKTSETEQVTCETHKLSGSVRIQDPDYEDASVIRDGSDLDLSISVFNQSN